MADEHYSIAFEIARDLLSIGAVTFSPKRPFSWASGLRSPIYCDNRRTMGFPVIRRAITSGFALTLSHESLSPTRIVGTATAGIPHAAWLADSLGLPMAYVRSKAKAHGKGNQIEGPLEVGETVVVIEDLVSTGMSSVAVVKALQQFGVKVGAVLAIFSYGLPQAKTAFSQANVELHTLTNFEAMLTVAQGTGALNPDAVTSLMAWHCDPVGWSKSVL